MIVSHKYKFIFIKTRKTAGTSIEYNLSKYLGKEDIITPSSEAYYLAKNFILETSEILKDKKVLTSEELIDIINNNHSNLFDLRT